MRHKQSSSLHSEVPISYQNVSYDIMVRHEAQTVAEFFYWEVT